MIQPLQLNSNLNFKASQMLESAIKRAENVPKETSVVVEEKKDEVVISKEEQKASTSVKEKYEGAKKKVTDVFKVVNNVTGVGAGVARGFVDGVVATTAVGVIGKAAKSAKNFNIFQIAGNIIKDTAKGAWGIVKAIPSIITKSPLENLKTVGSLPKKFYKDYLKDNKGVATAATTIGLGILAFRTIQGRISANKTNSNLDHATNQGHVK